MDIYVQMEMFNKNGFFIFIIENSWNTEQRKILLFKKMVFQLWWECQISFLATKLLFALIIEKFEYWTEENSSNPKWVLTFWLMSYKRVFTL